jgi:hypothetical protein
MEKLIEVNRRLQRPLFPPFYGAFRRRLVLREELLWRDDVDKGWEKRGLSACRYIPRYSLTGLITPVRKNLWGSAGVGSSDLFATQRDDLCYHLHVVYPGRYSCGSVSAVFTCGEKAYIAKQKKRHG